MMPAMEWQLCTSSFHFFIFVLFATCLVSFLFFSFFPFLTLQIVSRTSELRGGEGVPSLTWGTWDKAHPLANVFILVSSRPIVFQGRLKSLN
jgi:hypothetical protein